MADQTLGSEIDVKPVFVSGLNGRPSGSGRRRIHAEGKQQCLWLGTGPEAESVLRQFKESERKAGFKQHKEFLEHLLTTYDRSNNCALTQQPQREEYREASSSLVIASLFDDSIRVGEKSRPSDFLRAHGTVLHPPGSNEMEYRRAVPATPFSASYPPESVLNDESDEGGPRLLACTAMQPRPMISDFPMSQHMPGSIQDSGHTHHDGLAPQDQLSQLVEKL